MTIDTLYAAYGSDSGYLFGIPPQHRSAVELILEVCNTEQDDLRSELEQQRRAAADLFDECQRMKKELAECERKRDEYRKALVLVWNNNT